DRGAKEERIGNVPAGKRTRARIRNDDDVEFPPARRIDAEKIYKARVTVGFARLKAARAARLRVGQDVAERRSRVRVGIRAQTIEKTAKQQLLREGSRGARRTVACETFAPHRAHESSKRKF